MPSRLHYFLADYDLREELGYKPFCKEKNRFYFAIRLKLSVAVYGRNLPIIVFAGFRIDNAAFAAQPYLTHRLG